MKTSSVFLQAAAILLAASTLPVTAKTHPDCNLKEILLNVKEYRNDHVSYKAIYKGFTTNAPLFMDRSGFKEGKQVVIEAGSMQLPVIAELDRVQSTLATLKKGSLIKVFGKIKEFRVSPKRGINSGYYLDMEKMEVIKEAGMERGDKPRQDAPRPEKGL